MKRFITLIILVVLSLTLSAQDRLKSMPGYEQYQKMSRLLRGSVQRGIIVAQWAEDSKTFEYSQEGKRFRFDIAELKMQELGRELPNFARLRLPQPEIQSGLARNQQPTSVNSPDGKWLALCKARNLNLIECITKRELPLTHDGSEPERVCYGQASWVYGEELFQNSGIWWSPDSSKLAYCRFDESKVKDYFLQLDQTKIQSRMEAEPYPKAGTDNPVVDVYVYDLISKKTLRIDVREGKPFTNDVVGHYVYNVAWSPDGKELLFNRTNRKQNIMEFCAADTATGATRVIVRESWLASWTENLPKKQFLKDGLRFIWTSDRTGFRNYYLYDLSGKLLSTLTHHSCDVEQIVRVDEKTNHLYYLAHSGDNPMKLQLHRVTLDGKGNTQLTDRRFHHSVDLAPDGKHFIDTSQTHDQPESARLVNHEGAILAELSKGNATLFEQRGFKKVELFTFKAADGVTDLFGMLHFPSTFDPAKKYPLLVDVYAGPETNGARETFTLPQSLTEFGFLVATFDSRTAAGRGKKFLDAIYGKLGVVEIDDQTAGVKALWPRPYVDKTRVGIHGSSYGGQVAILCLLRHPEVFHAACASSAVTDDRNYDTIYTERYMSTPQDNPAGYEAGSALTYVKNLRGRLMLYFGTSDNNVHPSNAMQLIKALQNAGKSIELQIGPDLGHSTINAQRMMEFFIERLNQNY